jgi:hypothetical protein
MIRFTCPECNETLKATDERAGTRFKCGKCGNPVKVPAAAASVALAEASAEKRQLGLPAHPTPQRTPPRGVPIVWFGVAVAAAGLLGMCAGGGLTALVLARGLPAASTPTPRPAAFPPLTSSPQPTPVASEPPQVPAPAKAKEDVIVVDLAHITKPYDDYWNPITADARYLGKLVSITLGGPDNVWKKGE